MVTPERTVLDAAAEFVAVPMYDGELGVLPGRAPLIGRLGCGELRARRAGRVERYYVDGGFVQVRDNAVTVLTPKAIPVEEIDRGRALADIEAARRPAATLDERDAQQLAAAKARVMLRLSRTEDGGH